MKDFDDDMPALPVSDTDTDTDTQDADTALVPPSGGTPASLRDRALEGLDPETRSEIILEASDIGIRDRNDATWLMLRKLRDATDAATIADRAAGRIEAATQAVGDLVFRQAQRAGADIAATAATAIETKTVEAGQAIVTVINHAAQSGAAALKAAAIALPAAAAAQRDGILAEWQQALGATAAQEAAQRARRGEWLIMSGIAAGMIVMALLGAWVGHALAPKAWPRGAPPSAMWRYPSRDMDEYAWPLAHARVARACPPNDVCLDLRRR